MRGQRNHLAGLAAEGSVARHYARRGTLVLAERYRTAHGEVDLVVRDGDTLVFVEVKRGRSHDIALTRITRRQFDRIYAAAVAYAEERGGDTRTPMRFDLATVDQCGTVRLHPGVLAHF